MVSSFPFCLLKHVLNLEHPSSLLFIFHYTVNFTMVVLSFLGPPAAAEDGLPHDLGLKCPRPPWLGCWCPQTAPWSFPVSASLRVCSATPATFLSLFFSIPSWLLAKALSFEAGSTDSLEPLHLTSLVLRSSRQMLDPFFFKSKGAFAPLTGVTPTVSRLVMDFAFAATGFPFLFLVIFPLFSTAPTPVPQARYWFLHFLE